MDPRTLSHVLAFDDAPFARAHRGDVLIVGVAFAHLRLEGVISGRVRRDGRNAARTLARLCNETKFAPQTKVILLQGIALAGFNVGAGVACVGATPEPLRVAHLIAGGIGTGESRGRA